MFSFKIDAKNNLLNHRISVAAILFVACVLSYANSLRNQFLLDDYYVLFGDWGVEKLTSLSSLFTTVRAGFFRPVGYAFLRLFYLMFHSNAVWYHSANLLLFFIICMLFFVMTDMLFGNRRLSFLTALLYAIHPINGMLVNYVTASVISIFIVSAQLSFIFFLKFLEERKRILYVVSLFFFILSLLSHESSMMLPIYLCCTVYFLKHSQIKKDMIRILPYLFIIFGYLVYRLNLHDARPIGTLFQLSLTFVGYVSTIAQLISWYISKLVIPREMLFIWDIPVAGKNLIGWTLGFLSACALAGFLIFRRWRQEKLKAFSLAFFVAGFLPVGLASFVYTDFTKTAMIEPHWFYFSSVGFFILVAGFILEIRQYIDRRIWIVGFGALSFLLLLLTWQHNKLWRDEETYCAHWMSINPYNVTAKLNRAFAYIGKNDKGLEKSQYENCLRVAYLGGTYNIIGRTEEAKQYYRLALEMNPDCTMAYYGLGILYFNNREYLESEEALLKAIDLDPSISYFYEQLAAVYEREGKAKEAQEIRSRMPNSK